MATAYPVATMADGRIKYSDGSVRSSSQDRQTYAPIASSAKGPNYYLNSKGTLTYVDPKTGAVTQGIPNTPQSQNPARYPNTQQQAQAIKAQDIASGGFVWSSQEDYEMDRRKAQQMGYSSPEQMRAAERSKGLQSFQSKQPAQSFDFGKFLSSLNPVKPVVAAEIPGSSASDISQLRPGTLSANPIAEDRAALFKGLNPFEGSQSFTDRLKNIVSGITGQAGQAFNLPDIGTSEWIRGMGSGKKPTVGKQSYESSSSQAPRQSFADPKQLQSFLQSPKDGGEVLGLDTTTPPTNYRGSQDDLYNAEDAGGEWALLGPELENNRQELEQRIQAGEISGEDAIREQQRFQMELLTPYYEKLNQMALSGIPSVEANARKQIERLQGNLATYKESARPVMANVENTFGTAVRSAVENAQRSKTQLRNVYSSIGSAESSQFLDSLRNIDSELGKTTAGFEAQKGQQLGNINTGIMDQEKYTNQQIADIDEETKLQIKSIYDRVDLNNLQKTQQIGEIIQNAQDAITELQAKSREQLTNLDLLDRQAMINKDSLLTQGQIDQDTILQQANLLNTNLQSTIPYIPPEVDSVVRGFLAQPQSGGSKYFQLQALKGKYPDLAEFLDQVMGGQITSQSYNTLGGSQGAGNYNLSF